MTTAPTEACDCGKCKQIASTMRTRENSTQCHGCKFKNLARLFIRMLGLIPQMIFQQQDRNRLQAKKNGIDISTGCVITEECAVTHRFSEILITRIRWVSWSNVGEECLDTWVYYTTKTSSILQMRATKKIVSEKYFRSFSIPPCCRFWDYQQYWTATPQPQCAHEIWSSLMESFGKVWTSRFRCFQLFRRVICKK